MDKWISAGHCSVLFQNLNNFSEGSYEWRFIH